MDFGARKIKTFDLALIREFFKAFTDNSGMTLHVNVMYGKNNHHIAEAIFKAFARALREAVTLNTSHQRGPFHEGNPLMRKGSVEGLLSLFFSVFRPFTILRASRRG